MCLIVLHFSTSTDPRSPIVCLYGKKDEYIKQVLAGARVIPCDDLVLVKAMFTTSTTEGSLFSWHVDGSIH